MTNFIIFMCLLLVLYSINFSKNKMNFMDKKFTNNLKGLAIVTIVWAHVGGVLNVQFIQFIAGIGVCIFLICSGYGMQESYKKKKFDNFWKKRITKIYLPFCLVELIGMIVFYEFDIKKYLLDISFIQKITAYSWYMSYIIVCYIMFYIWKKISLKFNISENKSIIILLILFASWFIIESLFLVNPLMPFLKARQMLAFPFGVILSQKRDIVDNILKNKIKKYMWIVILGLFTCGLLFMGITQLSFIKKLNYLTQNILSLFTIFPITIAILAILFYNNRVIDNKFLNVLGKYSYEIYLVHSFTLKLITTDQISLVLFLIITIIATYLLHVLFERMNRYDRFNSNNFN